jgi:phosphate transport system substrate-binding protein
MEWSERLVKGINSVILYFMIKEFIMYIKIVIFINILLFSIISYGEGVTELNWAGCGITKKAFMHEIAQAYQVKYGVKINLQGGGATKGIINTKKGTAHLGGSCRMPIHNATEGSQLNHIQIVAWDGLVMVVNQDNPINNIDRNELIDILEGRITRWSQLSSWYGEKDHDIELITRSSNLSGVGFTYRKMLFHDVYKEIKGYKEFPSSGPVEKYIEKNLYALAITGVSSARKRDLKVLSFQKIEASFDNIKTGKYLLYRPLYLIKSVKHQYTRAIKNEIKRFVSFITSKEGANIIRDNGVVPYIDGAHLMYQQPDIFDM